MRTLIKPMMQNEHGPALAPFVEYLHAIRENERVALARKMHDELGSLLVSAAMDLGWAESHSVGLDMTARLRRLGVNLGGAIDMKRQMIEKLRPTLLDTFGLFEALRWYFKHGCHRVEADCNETLPNEELALTPLALSHVFRATQALLDCTFLEERLRTVELAASVHADSLSIRLDHEHDGPESVDVLERFDHELFSAAHRVAALKGELSFERRDCGLMFELKVPLREVQGQPA